MKLGYNDIAGFLKSPPQAVRGVLVYGPDGGLVRERAGLLAKAWGIDAGDPFNVIELTEASLLEDPARLADELSAMSLMGGRRLIRLISAGDKCAGVIADAFAHSAVGTKGDENILLALGDDLPGRSSLKALFEKERALAALPCYRDEGRNLEALIRSGLQGAGIQFDTDVLRYLVGHLGNDRGVTVSEIEKIALYMGDDKRLTLEVAAALVGQNDDLTVDTLAHAIADGNMPALDDALARLLAEGAQPVMILRTLARHFQRLQSLSLSMQNGKSADQAIEGARPPVFFRDKPMLKRQLGRWNYAKCVAALGALLECERQVKSGALAPELLTSKALFDLAAA